MSTEINETQEERSLRFGVMPDDIDFLITVPLCLDCLHFNPATFTCKAFPNGIPDEIYTNRHNHSKPYPGDHGITYEPK